MYADKILKDDYVEDIIIKRKDYKETVNKKASFDKSVIDRRENITSYKKISIKKEASSIGVVQSHRSDLAESIKETSYKGNRYSNSAKTENALTGTTSHIVTQNQQKTNSLSRIQEKNNKAALFLQVKSRGSSLPAFTHFFVCCMYSSFSRRDLTLAYASRYKFKFAQELPLSCKFALQLSRCTSASKSSSSSSSIFDISFASKTQTPNYLFLSLISLRISLL